MTAMNEKVGEVFTKHVQAGLLLFFGKVLQYSFHYNDGHVSFRQASGPVILKGTAGKHGTAVPSGITSRGEK